MSVNIKITENFKSTEKDRKISYLNRLINLILKTGSVKAESQSGDETVPGRKVESKH